MLGVVILRIGDLAIDLPGYGWVVLALVCVTILSAADRVGGRR